MSGAALEPSGWEKLDRMRKALGQCTFLPGHPHKRFARQINQVPVENLTERQRRHLIRLAWRYRRQMPRDLVPSKDGVEAMDSGWASQQVAGVTVYTATRPHGAAIRLVSKRRTVPVDPPMPPLLAAMVRA